MQILKSPLDGSQATSLAMTDASRLKSTVYVGGLDQAVTIQTLSEAFIPFGEIADISLPKPEAPSSTDVHRGFGYVEFEDPTDAREAIDNMDQSELYGRIIKVAAAKPTKDKDEGLGSKTAIWEQVCIRTFCSQNDAKSVNRSDIWQSMLLATRID